MCHCSHHQILKLCCFKFILASPICERIWEKGPYGAKTKLKLRLEIPLRVNPVYMFHSTTLIIEVHQASIIPYFRCIYKRSEKRSIHKALDSCEFCCGERSGSDHQMDQRSLHISLCTVALVDMKSVYLSVVNLCVQSLSRSLSVSIVIWCAMSGISVTVRTQAWYWLSGCTYPYVYIVTNIQAHARKYKFHHL